jgi:hypothetical protein
MADKEGRVPMALFLWSNSWAWGLPLIVITLIIHVVSLGLINRLHGFAIGRTPGHPVGTFRAVVVMGGVAWLATLLIAAEAAIWAVAYLALGAMPNYREAMLFSINAITTYGHVELFLAKGWQMMGALEALSGVLIFGLTTAFLFSLMQRVWPAVVVLASPGERARREA